MIPCLTSPPACQSIHQAHKLPVSQAIAFVGALVLLTQLQMSTVRITSTDIAYNLAVPSHAQTASQACT